MSPSAVPTVPLGRVARWGDNMAPALPPNAARRGEVAQPHFDAAWFVAFVEAHFHDKSKGSPVFGPVVCEGWQRDELTALMALDASGRLASVQWVVSWARRHGKTQWCGYYELARCLRYPNQVCVIQGSSEEHADEAAFARLVETIRESPCFMGEHKRTQDSFTAVFHPRAEVATRIEKPVAVDVLDGLIRFDNGSVIRSVNARARWGVRTSVYRATDLHQARDDHAFLAGKGSTGDSWCGLTVIDSTQGQKDQIVAVATRLGKDALATKGVEGDPGTRVSHVEYADLSDAIERRPPWIDERWLRSQAAHMAPGDFTRHHLNRATGAGLAAFPPSLLARARAHELSPLICAELCPWFEGSYTTKTSFDRLGKRFRGSGVLVGVGLDRSMGLALGDRTILTFTGAGVDERIVGKTIPVFDATGEAVDEIAADPLVVFPLAIAIVPRGSDTAIKRIFEQCVSLYGDPVGAAFETFQCKDVAEWCESQGWAVTLEAMTEKAKAEHVSHVGGLLAEVRLALPASMVGGAALLNAELERYAETEAKGRVPKYGAAKGWETLDLDGAGATRTRVKDDAPESFFWSTKPLRVQELAGNGGVYAG